jgi:hypothetical protein
MSPFPGTVEATVLTVVKDFRNGAPAAEAGNEVPSRPTPAARMTNVRDVRFMPTSETNHRAPSRYPLWLNT